MTSSPTDEPSQPLRFLGIGGPKTGSYTLAMALNRCGLRTVHSYDTNRAAVRSIQSGDLSRAGDIWSTAAAFFDGPIFDLVGEHTDALLRVVPEDTVFVHHVRDVEACITSALIHVLDHRLTRPVADAALWLEVSSGDLRAMYDRGYRLADELTQRGRRVVTVNICERDGSWGRLAPLLGIDPPEEPFPRLNTGSERLERICRFAAEADAHSLHAALRAAPKS